ncbi:MAG: hypothetical protein AAF891_06980 [Pseudomonadota bacterium]
MAQFVAQYWMVLGLAACAILVIAFLISEDAPVARRVFARFLFNIALPLAVIIGVPLMVLASLTDLPVQLWAAIVAGSVIATGWLTSTIFAELGRTQAKAERLRDYHKALYAEIGNTLAAYYVDGQAQAFADEIIEKMTRDADFVPFIPRETHDRVFSALVDEIEVLPRQTIDAVISFYGLVASIGALSGDMRGERFQQLEQDRRIVMYRDYIEMRLRAARMGEYTLRLIKAYSEGGAASANQVMQRVKRGINSPDADLPRPSAGSE